MFDMPDALPRALADYLATSAGQYMTHDATYFSWSLAERKIYVSGNVHPDQHPTPYHEADPTWDHRDWAGLVLERQTRELAEDDLIPIDGTELAKPYARHMQYQCVVKDASRVGDSLVNGYWCWGAYHWSLDHATLNPLMLRPYSPNQPAYRSENELIARWFWTLRQATAGPRFSPRCYRCSHAGSCVCVKTVC
jgi:hypothetical protein